MISQKTREKILSSSCIEDVIGDFVKLKKSGINYRGLSPFTNEKTPSLIVSPTKKIWKDFSSGKGGNIITFLMEHENFSYVESLIYLSKKYDIKIYEKLKIDHKYKESYERLYLIQDYAKRFFINQLFSTKEGKVFGLKYLIKKRGFNIKIIHKFELGYAPLSCKIFTEKSLEEKGLNLQDIKKYNSFDCFRKRVMFPIHNILGKVIGFGGRNINSGYSCYTKYINSSDSDIFQKGKILYGLFQAKKSILKEDRCYLVEGYTDVISLYQSGIKNVVSSSGISLTIDQIFLIKKFTKNIVLFYDGDRSGIKASLRVINILLEQGINLRIVLLINGEDPDSISRKYSFYQLKDFIKKNSYNFVSFKQKIYEKLHQDDPIKKSFLVLNILNSISKISSLIQKELYLQETSKILNIRQEVLIYELERIQNLNKKNLFITTIKEDQRSLSKRKNKNTILFIEEKLIQLILNYGNKIIRKKETVLERILHVFKCWNLRFSLKKNQDIFDNIQKEKIKMDLKKKNIKYYSLSKWYKKGIEVIYEEDNINRYLVDILLRYKSLYILELIRKEIILHKMKKYNNDKKTFLKRIMHLTNIKNEINKKLHRYV
ncbi:DNA primase [Blattabacterium cuenoti]|uniref:DNA primase n=1 Tax=Blattabacterium cuenoti TaxID=1653831 RepID=UPI00163CC388|nr:DNA primase [Blattabacterium cuenoti]